MAWKQHIRAAPGTGDSIEVEIRNSTEAIKLMCTECCGFEMHPSECVSKTCPLYRKRGKSLKAFGVKRARKSKKPKDDKKTPI